MQGCAQPPGPDALNHHKCQFSPQEKRLNHLENKLNIKFNTMTSVNNLLIFEVWQQLVFILKEDGIGIMSGLSNRTKLIPPSSLFPPDPVIIITTTNCIFRHFIDRNF